MSYLSINHIFKSYYLGKEAFPVLKDINLSFELGEFVSILGESGGGKSTLMNIIGGLDSKFDGTVEVEGQKLDHKNEKALDEYRRKTIGYIYQSYNLISHLTVLDNVLISLDMTTLSKKAKQARAKSLLEKVGLTDHIHKYPNQLSGGQKQRVAIARALANDPQIVIADEPTGALDSENTQEVLEMLKEIASEGRLVITVTHSPEVAKTGTRIVHLADGKIDSDERIAPAYEDRHHEQQLSAKPLSALISFKTALKHLKFNFGRNFLIAIGTAIGLFAVILFSGLGNGIGGYISKQITDMANPQVISVSRYTKSSAQQSPRAGGSGSLMQTATTSTTGAKFSTAQISKIKQIKHVSSVQKSYNASNVIVKKSSTGKTATASTISNWSKSVSTSSLKAGAAPKYGEVVLDKTSIADELTSHNWKSLIGKKVNLSYATTDKNGKPVTISLNVKVSGIIESSNSNIPSNYINTKTMTTAMVNANVNTEPSSVIVKIDHLDNVTTVTSKINKLQSNGQRLFKATSVANMIDTVQTYINLASTILASIAGISLVVSALMIIVTMYMSVSARTKEIGILRALGESKRDIRRLFISESLIIGLIAAALGTALAFGVGAIANTLLATIANYSFIQIGWANVVSVFLIALIISAVAAVLPARHAASINPIDALSAD